MDTPQIQKHVEELQTQVAPYSSNPSKPSSFSIKSLSSVVSSYRIYLILPVIVFILLLLFRPIFLYYDRTEKGVVKKKLSIKKFFICWAIASLVLILGLFGYNYKVKTG